MTSFRGTDGKVRGVKLNVYQTKLKKTVVINQPLQLIVPFEISNEPPEPAETIALSKPRREVTKAGSVKNAVFKSSNLM